MLIRTIRKIFPERYRPIGYLTSLAQGRTQCRIRSGPFTGMRYGLMAVGSAYIPKLLGIYERELAPLIELVCSQMPECIIDIGAAEGYYAVGLAMRNTSARVIAFEAEEQGRASLLRTAELNEVSARIEIRGRCEAADLETTLGAARSPIVVCDVEGYEEQLLDPKTVPSLRKATILVELHEFVRSGITELLLTRFAPTHQIRQVHQERRSRNEFPWRTFGTTVLPNSYLDWAVSEWRPSPMSWLWMEPISSLAK